MAAAGLLGAGLLLVGVARCAPPSSGPQDSVAEVRDVNRREAAHLWTHRPDPEGLVVTWIGGACLDGPPAVRWAEGPDAVSVLVAPDETGGSCEDVGSMAEARVGLTRPLGERRVLDVGQDPARDVPSEAAYEELQAARAAAYDEATDRCDEAAVGLRPLREPFRPTVFPTTVAVARTDVPEARRAWADLPGDQVVGHCYVQRADGRTAALLAVAGREPVVLDDDWTDLTLRPLPSDPVDH